jgi:rRNA small subunit pseudouridine methyltransferase Nep1
VTAVVERVVLVLVEAGLETVPAEISEHPAVRKFASRKGKKPTQVPAGQVIPSPCDEAVKERA